MGHTVFTLGRQFGSGGHEIGAKVAQKLGLAFYDKKLLEEVAAETGLDMKYLEQIDERPSSLLYNLSLSGGFGAISSVAYEGLPMPDRVFISISKMVREIASTKDALFVGRAADYMLAGTGAVNLFIHAPLATRISRISRTYEISESDAKSLINRMDKERSSYYSRYVGKRWGAISDYHLAIDSSLLGIDGTVELICSCAPLINAAKATEVKK